MTSNIDATIRAALLLNINHLLLAARNAGSKLLADRFAQSAWTFDNLYHWYNDDDTDVWSDTGEQVWGVDQWTQVQTALLNMSEKEAKPYHKQRALDMVEYRLGFAEQDAEEEAIQW